MQKIPVPFGHVVRVDWHDSKALDGWQYDPTMPRTVGRIRTIGMCVQTSDYALTITSSACLNGATMDDLSIPWGAIVEMEVLPDDYALAGPECD